jgi:Fe-S cluster assembly iron-binding protein IscA
MANRQKNTKKLWTVDFLYPSNHSYVFPCFRVEKIESQKCLRFLSDYEIDYKYDALVLGFKMEKSFIDKKCEKAKVGASYVMIK